MEKTIFTPLFFLLLVVIAGTFVLVGSSSIFFGDHENQTKEKKCLCVMGLRLFSFDSGNEKIGSNEPIKGGYKPDLHMGLKAVRTYLASGDYSSAENELKNLLIFYPDNRTALSLLGGIFYLSGKYNQAIVLFSNLEKTYPRDATIKEHIGVQYEKTKNYRMAIREFRDALNIVGDSSISHIHLAGLYSILGEEKEAMTHFQKAHALLGEKILAFSYDPAFDNIRNIPEFVVIVHKYSK